jgi:predicted Zn finger-like uncharacterized protein
VIVTCPACRTRYRADAAALARPGGRTVRCAACGHLWHHPSAALGDDLRAPAVIRDPPRLEPAIEAPDRPESVPPPAPPRSRFWLSVGLPIIVALMVVAVVAVLYFTR